MNQRFLCVVKNCRIGDGKPPRGRLVYMYFHSKMKLQINNFSTAKRHIFASRHFSLQEWPNSMETQIGQIPKSHGSYGKMPPCYNFHIEYRHFGSCHGEPTIRHRSKNTSCFCSGRQLDWRNGGHVVQGMRPVKPPQVQGLSDEVHIHGFKDGHLGIVYVWCVFHKTL